MLIIKEGVDISDIAPEMAIAAQAVARVYEWFLYDCIITSARDGSHKEGSLHYDGMALDFRTRHLSGGYTGQVAQDIAQKVRECLGAQFDVVLERTHLHVEFDPW